MSETPAPRPRTRPRRGRRAAAAPAAAIALALALAGCGSMSGGSSSGSADTKFVQGTGEITTLARGHRPAAPDISGKSVEGKPLSFADYPGKIIVLNVWGSWCDPCRAEAPNLEKVSEQTAGKGVQFIGVNIRDEDPAQSRSFERGFKIDYPSLYDPDGRLLLKFPRGSVPPQSIPTTLILDRQHKIAVRALKALTTDELRKALDPIIAEK